MKKKECFQILMKVNSHSGWAYYGQYLTLAEARAEIRRIKADKNPISDQFMLRRIEHICSFAAKTKKFKI